MRNLSYTSTCALIVQLQLRLSVVIEMPARAVVTILAILATLVYKTLSGCDYFWSDILMN
ncbi:hypothetical protein [Lactiplantibacillus pentosus]|uniref:hypothetical protein n=1 Tax=Lactiplantibacillus pentosus TaxID=1589 RepID=UPI0021A57CCE|nr:hypothetical protein [Lactiplantibacillus pentosus]MCT3066087.1 hypothetical protein [Lactiplantibacillus pentosus]